MGLVLSVTLVHVGLTRSKEGKGKRTIFRRQRVENRLAAADRGQFESLHSFRAKFDQL
jgi:hypothetical protein